MKSHYTTYELAAVTNNSHSNIKSCLKHLLETNWIMHSDIEHVKDGIKRYYILNSDDAHKLIFKLAPRLAYFLYTSNVTL